MLDGGLLLKGKNMAVTQNIYSAKENEDVRFASGQFTSNLEVDGNLTVTGTTSATGAISANVLQDVQTISEDGAISVVSSAVDITKGTAAALTIAAPTAAQEGTTIMIRTTTAAAHVITGAFRASNDTATFTAAAGNSVILVARNLRWVDYCATGVAFTTA